MRHILTSVFLVVLLFPSLALGLEMDDLVRRGGLYYEKFTNIPFTGEVTGVKQGRIKDGKMYGLWVNYHENGLLWMEGTQQDAKTCSAEIPTILWHNCSRTGTWRHGPWVLYYDNGRLEEKGAYKDGKWDGPWVEYFHNGQLRSKGTYKDGEREGPWVFYHDNGQLSEKGTYKRWEKEGPWVAYHEDGTVNDERTGTYKDRRKVD